MLILYNPPSNATRKPVLPMSLLAVGAVLEGEHDYRIVDGNLVDDPLAALDRAITETKATILGVTVMPGPQLANAVPTCRELKRRHPHLTVVWGGYFPTQHYEATLRSDYVDYVVRSHGEIVFKALLDALRDGTDPSTIPGLAYRCADNDEPMTNHLAPLPHPERMPDFPYHRIEVPRYVRNTFLGRRTLAHHSSYGCPFLCNFCGVVSLTKGRWNAQSPERVQRALARYVADWRVDAVEFYDNNFFTHEERCRVVADRIAPLSLRWWGEGRIDTLLKFGDGTWRAMRESGLRMVFLGAESGSRETLARMDKGGTLTPEMTLDLALGTISAIRGGMTAWFLPGAAAMLLSLLRSRRTGSQMAATRPLLFVVALAPIVSVAMPFMLLRKHGLSPTPGAALGLVALGVAMTVFAALRFGEGVPDRARRLAARDEDA